MQNVVEEMLCKNMIRQRAEQTIRCTPFLAQVYDHMIRNKDISTQKKSIWLFKTFIPIVNITNKLPYAEYVSLACVKFLG